MKNFVVHLMGSLDNQIVENPVLAWVSTPTPNAGAPTSWEQSFLAVLGTASSSAGMSGARATFGLKNAWARARAPATRKALFVYKKDENSKTFFVV